MNSTSPGISDHARATGPALDAHYRFILWLVPAVTGFPRSQKFVFGDRMQNAALVATDATLEAYNVALVHVQ